MENLNESLLNAWLRISTSVVNSRVVSELPYNESLVCNVLLRNSTDEKSKPMTATELCEKTNMLKSQMNRTLNLLEDKGIILRERSSTDKRQVLVTLVSNKDSAYERQHTQILQLLDKIIEELGIEKTYELINSLNNVSDIADKILKRNRVNH